MGHTHLPRHAVITLAGTLAVLFHLDPPLAPCPAPNDPTPQEIRSRMLEIIDRLWNGTPETKRDAAERAFPVRRGLEASPLVIDSKEAESVVDSLRLLLRAEPDDWITSRLSESLSSSSSTHLDPFFRDALESPSVNLRWQAIQRYVFHEDQAALDALEAAWRFEDRPWVVVDLIHALTNHGSSAYVQDFLRLTRSEDRSISLAAIEALGELGDSRALPRLIDLARSGRAEPRAEALEALASWPDSVEALQAILESTRSDDSAIREPAIRSLGSFDDASAADRLLEIVRGDGRSFARAIAIEELEDAPHPGIVPALLDVLREVPEAGNEEAGSAALMVLFNRDDPSALPGLLNLDPAIGSEGLLSVTEVIAHLSRDRSAAGKGKSTIIRTHCSFRTPIGPEDPDALRVLPPPGQRSVRCWAAPGISGDPEFLLRIPTGHLVTIEDYFERPDDLWIMVEGLEDEDCWVPRRLLVGTADGFDIPAQDWDGLLSAEFDLPATELQSDAAARLMAADLLVEIDPGGEVVGVALSIDPDEARQVELMARAYNFGESILQEKILGLIRPLADRYKTDQALGPLMRFAEEEAEPE